MPRLLPVSMLLLSFLHVKVDESALTEALSPTQPFCLFCFSNISCLARQLFSVMYLVVFYIPFLTFPSNGLALIYILYSFQTCHKGQIKDAHSTTFIVIHRIGLR